jgi:hypothetical protein
MRNTDIIKDKTTRDKNSNDLQDSILNSEEIKKKIEELKSLKVIKIQ